LGGREQRAESREHVIRQPGNWEGDRRGNGVRDPRRSERRHGEIQRQSGNHGDKHRTYFLICQGGEARFSGAMYRTMDDGGRWRGQETLADLRPFTNSFTNARMSGYHWRIRSPHSWMDFGRFSSGCAATRAGSGRQGPDSRGRKRNRHIENVT
jgi:hypothetical protein